MIKFCIITPDKLNFPDQSSFGTWYNGNWELTYDFIYRGYGLQITFPKIKHRKAG
jgi:hypothetical protein